MALGWTHECSPTPDAFEERDTKYWKCLEQFVYHQGLEIGNVKHF